MSTDTMPLFYLPSILSIPSIISIKSTLSDSNLLRKPLNA